MALWDGKKRPNIRKSMTYSIREIGKLAAQKTGLPSDESVRTMRAVCQVIHELLASGHHVNLPHVGRIELQLAPEWRLSDSNCFAPGEIVPAHMRPHMVFSKPLRREILNLNPEEVDPLHDPEFEAKMAAACADDDDE